MANKEPKWTSIFSKKIEDAVNNGIENSENIKTPGENNKQEDDIKSIESAKAAAIGSLFLGVDSVKNWIDLASKSKYSYANKKTSILYNINKVNTYLNIIYKSIDKLNTNFNDFTKNFASTLQTTLQNTNITVAITGNNIPSGTITSSQGRDINISYNDGFNYNGDNGVLMDLLNFFDNLSNENLKMNASTIIKNLTMFNNIFGANKNSLVSIQSLLNSLDNTAKDITSGNVSKSISIIGSFFSTIKLLSDISLIERLRIKLNLLFINKFITQDILSIISDINSSGIEIEKISNMGGAFYTLNSFFEAISTIANIEKIKKLRMKMNILFIKDFILQDIVSIINTIEEVVNSNSDRAYNSLEALNNIITYIVKLTEFGFFKIFKLHVKSEILSSIISSFIESIIDPVVNINDSLNGAINNYELISNKLLDSLIKIVVGLPELKQSIVAKQKIVILSSIISSLGVIISKINNLETLKERKLKQFQKGNKYDKLIDNIKRIIDKFNKDIDVNKIKQITDSLKDLSIVVAISGAILIGASLVVNNVNTKALILFTATLNMFILGISYTFYKFKDGFKDTLQGIKDVMLIVALSGGIMLAGGTIAQLVKPESLILFTLSLNILIFGISYTFHKFNDGFKETLQGVKDAAIIIALSGGILLAAALIMNGDNIWATGGFAVILGVFLAALTDIFIKFNDNINESLKGAKDAMLIVTLSGGILLAAALIMNGNNLWLSMGFAVTLGVFITSLMYIFNNFKDDIKESLSGAKDIAILVGISGAVLLAGALVSKLIDVGGLITFTIMLGAFVYALLHIFGSDGEEKQTKYALSGAKDIMLIVTASGAILLAGGIIMKYVDIVNLIAFTVLLAGFVWAITATFNKVNDNAAEALKGAAELSILIVVAGAVLLAGGLIIKNNWSLIIFSAIFGVLLAAFIWGICKAITINDDNIKDALRYSIAVSLLIVVAGAILLAGGAIIKNNWELIAYSALFGLMLLAFIGGLCLIFAITKKPVQMAIRDAIGVSILLVVSGALLLAASYIIKQNGGLADDIWEYLGLVGLLIVGVVTITGILGTERVKRAVTNGLLTMVYIELLTAGIVGIIWLLGKALKEWDVNSLENMKTALTVVGGMFIAIGVIAASLGWCAGYMAAGLAVIGGIELLIFGIVKIIQEISVTVKMLDEVKDADFDKITDVIKGFAGLAKTLGNELFDWSSLKLLAVMPVILGIGTALSSIAQAVKDWADLRIPVYDGDKISHYITIGEDEFAKASGNIIATVTLLTKSIISIYDNAEDKSIFDSEGGFFGRGDSKFAKVIRAMKLMGPTLSSIAKGVKEWASLRIPEYKGMKQVGWITITSKDFPTVKQNISSVVTALGQAIIDVYKHGDKTMFESDSWFNSANKTPFAKVIKAMKLMGPTLSSIAKGVKQWADFKIPIYNGMKQTGWMTINGGVLTQANENIKSTITSLGSAIVEVYKADTDHQVFGDDKHKSVAKTVLDSISYMGDILNKTALTVSYYASGYFPVIEYNNGKITMTRSKDKIGSNELSEASTTIEQILTALGRSMVSVVKDEKTREYFALGENSAAAVAVKSVKNVADAIVSITKVITDINKLSKQGVLSDEYLVGENGLKSQITNMLLGFVSIIGCFMSEADVPGNSKEILGISFGGKVGQVLNTVLGKQSIAEYIESKIPKISNAANQIENFANAIVKMSDAVKKILEVKKTLWAGKLLDVSQFINTFRGLSRISTLFDEDYVYKDSEFGDKTLSQILESLDTKNTEKINKAFEGVNKIITTMSSLVKNEENSVYSIIAKSQDKNGKNTSLDIIESFITRYNDLITSIIVTPYNGSSIESSITTLTAISSNMENIKSVFTGYNELIIGIVEIGKQINDNINISTPFDTLTTTIKRLYDITSSITEENNKGFKEYVKDTSDLTNSINYIDYGRAKILLNILKQLNELSSNGAPMSQLANAITNDLTAAYDRLTKGLKDVKVIMDKADKIQKSRENSIKKNVNTVKELMDKHLNVDIRKIDTDTSMTFGGDDRYGEDDENNEKTSTLGAGANTGETKDTNNKQQAPQTKNVKVSNNQQSELANQQIIVNAIKKALRDLNLAK